MAPLLLVIDESPLAINAGPDSAKDLGPSGPSPTSLKYPKVMDITALPTEIFDILVSHLSLRDVVRCRRVDRKWQIAFSETDTCRQLLLDCYPNSREVRSRAGLQSLGADWAALLARVAARYHHLERGVPCHCKRLKLAQSFVVPEWCRHYPVGTWRRELQFENKTALFQHPDTLWTYDDG
jgi:hypothetical protein